MLRFKWKNKPEIELTREDLLEIIDRFYNKIKDLQEHVCEMESIQKQRADADIETLKGFLGF